MWTDYVCAAQTDYRRGTRREGSSFRRDGRGFESLQAGARGRLKRGATEERNPSEVNSKRRKTEERNHSDERMGPETNRERFREAIIHGGVELVAGCIQRQSNERYKLPIQRWKEFVDLFMEDGVNGGHCLEGVSEKERLRAVVGFLYHLGEDLGLAGSTSIQHLSAVKHHFRSQLASTDIFSHASVKAARISVMVSKRTKDALGEGRLGTIPVTVEMIEDIHRHLDAQEGEWSVRALMLLTAAVMAFQLMLRIGEYAVVQGAGRGGAPDHAIKAKNVFFRFSDKDDKWVSASEISRSKDKQVWRRSPVSGVKVVMAGQKNDKKGTGTVFVFDTEDFTEGDLFNLPATLFKWVMATSQLAMEDNFFTYLPCGSSSKYSLTSGDVQKELQDWGERRGLSVHERRSLRPHGYRYGGACAFRNADASTETIMHVGRWRSLSSALGYQVTGKGANKTAAKLYGSQAFRKGFSTRESIELTVRPEGYRSHYGVDGGRNERVSEPKVNRDSSGTAKTQDLWRSLGGKSRHQPQRARGRA